MNPGQVQVAIQYNVDQMPDIHICGRCKVQFTSLQAFISHKTSCCPLLNNLLNATTLVPLPRPGAVITPVATSAPPCTPSSTTSRKQRRKPFLLGTSPKVPQLATASNATPSQPCEASTSISVGQNLDDSAPSSSPELPQANSIASLPLPSVAEESAMVPIGDSVTTDGSKSTEVKSKGKGVKCYKCTHEKCGFETAHLKDIIRHRRIHTGDRPFACNFCQRRFTRKDKLQLHIRMHNGEKPFTCELCPYAAVDGGSLKKHMRTHTKERPFKCQICTYASRNSSQLTTHLRTHTGDTPFHCQQCSAKFKINTDLRRHLRIHTGEKPFKCSLCPYASALNSNLKSHIKNNHLREKKFQCEDCSFTCCTNKQLKQHEGTHPTHNPIIHVCLECDFLCRSKRALRRHMRTHSKEKAYKCPHCSFTAKYNSRIPTHIKKSHPDLPKQKRPKKAIKRKKAEKGKSDRRRKPNHSTVQLSGKKPFVCDKCKDAFMRKESYMTHMRQHEHGTTTIESAALAVLQLQQLPPLPATVPNSTTNLTRTTANHNQNNSSIFSDLISTPPACKSDIEMLFDVIVSQASANPITSDVDPGADARSSIQKQPSKSTSQNVGQTQLLDSSTSTQTIPIRSRQLTSSSNSSDCIVQSHTTCITILPQDKVTGDKVTLEVIAHNADNSPSLAVTPSKPTASLSDQQYLLRQLPMVRNQQVLQIPQLQPELHIPPAIQPASQQLLHSSLNQSRCTSRLPIPASMNTPHRGFLPQFNRPSIPVSQNVVGNLSLMHNSNPQGFPNPTRTPSYLQQPPGGHQSLVQHAGNTSSLTGHNLNADVMQVCMPRRTTSSTMPQISQHPTSAQQNVCNGIIQFQTGMHQSQPRTTFGGTSLLPFTNTVQTVSKFSSQNTLSSAQMGQLHVTSQHQLPGSRHQPNHQQQVPVGAAGTQLMSVPASIGLPLSTKVLAQQVLNHPQQSPSQQQHTVEPIRQGQHMVSPYSSILHVPQLTALSACDTLMSPTVIGDMNIQSLGVTTQLTSIVPSSSSV